MPAKRKPKQKAPDVSQEALRQVQELTESGPVNGEDLLPPRLAKQVRAAKEREKKPNGPN